MSAISEAFWFSSSRKVRKIERSPYFENTLIVWCSTHDKKDTAAGVAITNTRLAVTPSDAWVGFTSCGYLKLKYTIGYQQHNVETAVAM